MTLSLPRNNWLHALMAVGLLLLCLVILYVILILPAVNGRNAFQDRYDDLHFQFTRFSNTADQMDQIKLELNQLQNTKADTAGFLEANARPLAAADLQKHLQNLIESNNGNLISTQIVQGNEEEIFPAVTVKVHMRADIEALQNILFQLETRQPVLLIDDLFLQSRNQATPRNIRQRARLQQASLIEARFEITGFIYQEAEAL